MTFSVSLVTLGVILAIFTWFWEALAVSWGVRKSERKPRAAQAKEER